MVFRQLAALVSAAMVKHETGDHRRYRAGRADEYREHTAW